MHLYVEGGGDTNLLRTACRKGFSEFLGRAGLTGHMPRIVACGGRRQVYEDFCVALRLGRDAAMLLVDSEDPVTASENAETLSSPWVHLAQRPGDCWPRPPGASDDDCHLMVQCMESWFLADRRALEQFFGQGYDSNALPAPSHSVELIARQSIVPALQAATKNCKTKRPYRKGEHSFKLLEQISPQKVVAASPRAKHFITIMKQRMGC